MQVSQTIARREVRDHPNAATIAEVLETQYAFTRQDEAHAASTIVGTLIWMTAGGPGPRELPFTLNEANSLHIAVRQRYDGYINTKALNGVDRFLTPTQSMNLGRTIAWVVDHPDTRPVDVDKAVALDEVIEKTAYQAYLAGITLLTPPESDGVRRIRPMTLEGTDWSFAPHPDDPGAQVVKVVTIN